MVVWKGWDGRSFRRRVGVLSVRVHIWCLSYLPLPGKWYVIICAMGILTSFDRDSELSPSSTAW